MLDTLNRADHGSQPAKVEAFEVSARALVDIPDPPDDWPRDANGYTTDLTVLAGDEDEALHLTQENLASESSRIRGLAARLRDSISRAIPHTNLNGHPDDRLANNVSLSFEGADARDLLEDLDRAGIMVSAGAACNATTIEPSHVLIACGLPLETAAATLRFTLGAERIAALLAMQMEQGSACLAANVREHTAGIRRAPSSAVASMGS